MLIILLEGPDGAGKTYLANKFIEKYKFSYIHSTRPKNPGNIHEYSVNTWSAAKLLSVNDMDVIVDRHFLSQIIYQEVFEKGKSSEDFTSPAFLNGFDKIIICLPEKEKYFEKFQQLKEEREELYNNMTDIYKGYENIYEGFLQHQIENKFYNSIIAEGGLKRLPNVYKYDMYNTDLDKFIVSIKEGVNYEY